MHSALPRFLVTACLLTLGISGADLAPPADFEGKTISAIRWDPPSQPVLRQDLARLMPIQAGNALHADDVRTAIKKLYSTGLYSNIEVEVTPGADGVALTFRTTEQWFVGPVEVRGGKVKLPPSEGQLQNATRLELGTPYDDQDLQTAEENMRALLERNGLYLAKIAPKIDRDNEHQDVSLTFRVDSGKRARFTLPIIIGDTKVPTDKVAHWARYHGIFRWKQATQENTQAGVQNIRKKYEKQNRLTADVTLKDQKYNQQANRVDTTIEAQAGPKIKIDTDGAKVSKGKLETYVPVFDEETVNRDLLVSGVRNLRDYFQNKGYFDAQVDFRQKDISADEREITFVITPGVRHKVIAVDVKGNHYFTADEIRERLFIHKAGTLILRHGRYSDGFAKRDKDSVEALYRDNGFHDIDVNVDAKDDYKGKAGDVAVTFVINEGAQYKVSALNIEGMTRKDQPTIVAMLATQPGEPYSETSVALDRNYILSIYQSSGYPDATFEYHATPDKAAHTMAIRYTIVEGAPRYVRDVLITGMRTTRPRLVDPNISISAGEPLSWTEMGRMQRRLYNLGVFDKVDMAIQNPQGDTEQKYILFHLTEGHKYYTAIGFGAEVARIGGSQTSLDNPGGATGFAPRGDFEFSRLNLWGLGHSLNFKSRYSTLDRRVSLNYLAPRYRNVEGRNISFTALYDNTRDVLTFTARRLEGSMQVSQRYSKATTFLWRYDWRDVRVDPNTLKIDPLLIPLQAQPARIAMPAANMVQDRRDDPTNAHRGYYNSVDFGVAERDFGGNKNFTRFLGRNSLYKTFHTDWVIASNTQFGWIRPFSVSPVTTTDPTTGVSTTAIPDPFNYVPIAEHFFGGGSVSHRGFPDNQAGPRDLKTGFPLGGDALFFHSTELRFPFLGENMQGVIFHDMGNVYKDLGSISFRVHQQGIQDFDYMVHAAGFGIRYRTPVGPVRVDLAYSINPPTFFGLKGTYRDLILGTATPQIQSVSHFQFFISIGQAF
jgi:outer membrane protein insertion porin family